MKEKQLKLKEKKTDSSGAYERIFELSPDSMFKIALKDFKFVEVNDSACAHYGYTRAEFKELHVHDLELDDHTGETIKEASKVYPIGKFVEIEGVSKRKDGLRFPTQIRFCKLDDLHALIILHDITDQKEIEAFNQEYSKAFEITQIQNRRLELDKEVLAKVVQHRPLDETMAHLCIKMEEILSGGIVMVLLLSPDGKCLSPLVVPSMSIEFFESIKDLPVGPNGSTCGVAAHLKEQVIVEDIEKHDSPYRPFLLSYDLKSSWSTPIISSEKVVLGTFAIYFKTKRKPNDVESELLNVAVNLAKVGIEHNSYQESLRKINAEYSAQNKELETAKIQLEIDKKILIRSQEKLEEAQRFSRVGHWECDFVKNQMIWSEEQYRIFEMEGVLPENISEVHKSRIHPDDIAALKETMNKGVASKEEFTYEHRILFEDQRIKYVMGFGKAIYNEAGKLLKMKGVEHDVTELKVAQEAALEQEGKLNELLANINEIVFAVDLKDTEKYDNPITYINGDTHAIFGYSNEEMMAVSILWTDRIHPDDLEQVIEEGKRLQETQKQVVREYRFRHRKGHYIWIEDNVSLGDHIDGKFKVLYGSVRDITERKAAEAALLESRISNEEKDVLLKEIHHRVKNNLQVITSLLSLQSSFLNDEDQKKLFADSQYRINSMAIVHEMLYQSDNLSKVNYEYYLEELSEFLIRSMKGNENSIELLMDVPNINLGIDTAIPLGLLINEILTNSLKYGFKNEDKGQIYIKIIPPDNLQDKDAFFVLKIGDNGIGYPIDLNFRNSKSLGLKLIRNLTKQLEGKIERDATKKGTNYIISFKEI